MEELFDGLLVWEAINSGGSPICISDDTLNDNSLAVNLYRNAEGSILGVEIWGYTEDDMELLHVAGRVPFDAIRELLKVPEDEDIWFPADEVVENYNNGLVDLNG